MTILKTSTAAVCVFFAACGAASAIDLNQEMPTSYYDELNAKLIGMGYREVHVVNAEKYHISAYDKDGSEVLMIAHPSNHTIVSTGYVHPHDN